MIPADGPPSLGLVEEANRFLITKSLQVAISGALALGACGFREVNYTLGVFLQSPIIFVRMVYGLGLEPDFRRLPDRSAYWNHG